MPAAQAGSSPRLAEKTLDEVGNAFLSPIFSTMPLDGQGARLPEAPGLWLGSCSAAVTWSVPLSITEAPSVFIANPYLDLAPPEAWQLAVRCGDRVKAIRLRTSAALGQGQVLRAVLRIDHREGPCAAL